MNYQEDRLNALLSFISENTPHLRQSMKETKKILKSLQADLYEEIDANLSERNGFRARRYDNFVAEKFQELTFFKYLVLGFDTLEEQSSCHPVEQVQWKNCDRKEFKNLGIRIEHIYDENELPEVKTEKLTALVMAMRLFMKKLCKVESFLQERLQHGEELQRMFLAETGLAPHLERAHEQAYFRSLSEVIRPHDVDGIKRLKNQMELLTDTGINLIMEIDNNYHRFAAKDSRPYMEHLIDRIADLEVPLPDLPEPDSLFSGNSVENKVLKNIWQEILKVYEEKWLEARAMLLFYLDERLEVQEQGPYLLHLDQEPPLTANQQFYFLFKEGERNNDPSLTLELRTLFEGSEEAKENLFRSENAEEALMLELQKEFGLSESDVITKLDYLKDPDGWTDQDKADFKIAEERLDRTRIWKFQEIPEDPVMEE